VSEEELDALRFTLTLLKTHNVIAGWSIVVGLLGAFITVVALLRKRQRPVAAHVFAVITLVFAAVSIGTAVAFLARDDAMDGELLSHFLRRLATLLVQVVALGALVIVRRQRMLPSQPALQIQAVALLLPAIVVHLLPYLESLTGMR
jgi:hypothetical protein